MDGRVAAHSEYSTGYWQQESIRDLGADLMDLALVLIRWLYGRCRDGLRFVQPMQPVLAYAGSQKRVRCVASLPNRGWLKISPAVAQGGKAPGQRWAGMSVVAYRYNGSPHGFILWDLLLPGPSWSPSGRTNLSKPACR